MEDSLAPNVDTNGVLCWETTKYPKLANVNPTAYPLRVESV